MMPHAMCVCGAGGLKLHAMCVVHFLHDVNTNLCWISILHNHMHGNNKNQQK